MHREKKTKGTGLPGSFFSRGERKVKDIFFKLGRSRRAKLSSMGKRNLKG